MKPWQPKAQSIAIVDDDPDVRKAVHALLRSAGFPARPFASAEEFLGSGHRSETACLITDIEMPGMNGLELHAKLTADGLPIPTIFITAYGDARTRSRAINAGAFDFLEKPFEDDILLDRVRTALGNVST